MKIAFDSFVGIDWSGDKQKWQEGLKIAYALPGSSVPKLISGPGPKGKWSRTDAVSWMVDLVEKERALIGLDFSFGFPPTGMALDWQYVESLCCADENFYGGEFFRNAKTQHSRLVNSPWLPRDGYSAGYLRTTDHAAKLTKGATPQSIFNAVGAAQVGPSSISGMRALRYLKEHLGRKISIWPFDVLDEERSVIVEIFPRYFPLSKGQSPKLSDLRILNAALTAFGSATTNRPPQSEDEGDALLSAAALRWLSADPTLFEVESEFAKAEGWIFGIPCNDSVLFHGLTDDQAAEIERR